MKHMESAAQSWALVNGKYMEAAYILMTFIIMIGIIIRSRLTLSLSF